MKNRKLINPNDLKTNVRIVGEGNNFRPSISDERRDEILSIIDNPAQKLAPHEKLLLSKTDDGFSSIIPKISEERLIDRSLLIPSPSEWNFFGLPDQEAYGMLLKSIIVYGLFNPITVWEQNNGKYMVLSGHTRESCFHELYEATGDEKYASIPCKVYYKDDINSEDARRIIILSNIGGRAKENLRTRVRCMSELASLANTERSEGKSINVLEIAAKALGYSRVMAFHYKNITKLIKPIFELFANGEIPVRNAVILSGLDIKLQEYMYNQSYIDKITGKNRNLLKNAITTKDIDIIFSHNDYIASYNITLNLPYEKPEGCSFLPIFIQKGEIENFCDLLETESFPLPSLKKQLEYFRNLSALGELSKKRAKGKLSSEEFDEIKKIISDGERSPITLSKIISKKYGKELTQNYCAKLISRFSNKES